MSESRAARVLVFLPSWLGDTVMATPTLRLLREAMPRSVIVGLVRPGLDELLSGSDLLDDIVVADGRSVTGPAKIASKLVPLRLDAALLLPNSFASAMTVRLAGIPIRVGYDRDGRGVLLTERLLAPRRVPPRRGWEPVSAVNYYLNAGRALLETLRSRRFLVDMATRTDGSSVVQWTPMLELSSTERQDEESRQVLIKGGIDPGPLYGEVGAACEPFALINPGGNNPAKRWPVERFAGVAHHLISQHRLKVAINGSPSEGELVSVIRDAIVLDHPEDERMVVCLHELGGTVASLKGIVRRAKLVLTNDTGPRHIAAAFGVPCVSLFGPTDPRWTLLPEHPGTTREIIITADPTLAAEELADDHPERCRIDRITTAEVIRAVDRLLGGLARAEA